jgi:S-adenosylmethionine-diacylgycerolhomoserine-N-methlytransferase
VERYYRFQSKLYDATRWAFLFGRRRLNELIASKLSPDRVLEVGCGTGVNLAFLARRLPDAKLTGVDLSEAMLAKARKRLERHRLTSRVELVHDRYPALPSSSSLEGRRFDVISFSYSLTMMGPVVRDALDAARSSLSNGGHIAMVDFHDSNFPGFRQWMALNHVEVKGQLLPHLDELFEPSMRQIRSAFLGLWKYLIFVGRPRV